MILEKILKKPLEQLAQEIIFEPLNMTHSSYHWKRIFDADFAYGHMKSGAMFEKDKDNEPRGGSTLETNSSDYTKFLLAVLNQEIITKHSWNEIFKGHFRLKSLTQFGPGSKIETDKYDDIKLAYGLGFVSLETPFGKGIFKEGHGNGFQHYSILFPKAKMGIMIMTNSDNGESIFKELLEISLKDAYTPWEWENYIPYNAVKK